jgi:hypothetical protein
VLPIAGGAIAGVIAGIAAGIGARVAMRMVALGYADASMQVPEFTPAGTTAILITGTVVGAPAGVIFERTLRSLPGPRSLRGLLFGTILLLTLGPLFFFGTEGEFFSNGRIALFVPLFLLYGIVIGVALGPATDLARWLPSPARAALAFAAIAGGAFVAFGIFGIITGAISARGLGAVPLFVPLILLAALAWASRSLAASTATHEAPSA